MKCRLLDNQYADKNFQIEFDSISELEDLKSSLSSMIKYFNMCKADGEKLPPLLYKISEKTISNNKTNEKK